MSKSILKVPSRTSVLDASELEQDLSLRQLPKPPKAKKKVGFSDEVVTNVYENFMTEEEEETYRKMEEQALVALGKADFVSDVPGDLNFKQGQLIADLVEEEGGWWSGEIDGTRGVFPNTFVRFMPKAMAVAAAQLAPAPVGAMKKLSFGGANDSADADADADDDVDATAAAPTFVFEVGGTLAASGDAAEGGSSSDSSSMAVPVLASPRLLKSPEQTIGFKRRSSLLDTKFEKEPWYHGTISRKDTEQLFLQSSKTDGWFLIRKSTRAENAYVISQSLRGQLYHNQVFYRDGKFCSKLAGDYATLTELIDKHKSERGGLQSCLVAPCVRHDDGDSDDAEDC